MRLWHCLKVKREKPDEMMQPAAAYDRIASQYARISDQRRAYLDQVESLVIGNIPGWAESLLDVGAGDGTRAERIARAASIEQLVLLEPSAAMRGNGVFGAESLPITAEELTGLQREFDVITCLWNVLGHIDRRADVLRQLARLLTPHGLIFIDVNHRYNAASYGLLRTAGRLLYDVLKPSPGNGDVVARWALDDGSFCKTKGHVFTDREVRKLVSAAELHIRKRFVIDYSTGEVKKWGHQGNLLYVLGKTAVT